MKATDPLKETIKILVRMNTRESKWEANQLALIDSLPKKIRLKAMKKIGLIE